MPHIDPFVVAIWCGHGSKPSNLNDFLNQFVRELNEILSNHIVINGHQITLEVRSFICDTPARSQIKGSFLFNSCIQNSIELKINNFMIIF